MVVPTPTTGYDKTRIQQAFNSRTLAGLGCEQWDSTGEFCLDSIPTDNNAGSVTWNPGYINTGYPYSSNAPNPVSLPSIQNTGMSPAQLALYAAILNNAGTIGKELALQPGVSISPTGAVSQQNPGYAIAGTPSSLSLSGGSSNSLMMIALVGIVLMNSRK